MGKWTTEYCDDVLGAKIKRLVSGALKRSKLEKLEPSISYETFVQDLDPGDSFTTTLTELLVREMAERRQRQAADRGLISDRTAKGLRTLAAPQRVYRDRTGRGSAARRTLNLSDYLSVPPEEMDLDDDNDSMESIIDHPVTIEGTRMNTDLYDALHRTPYFSLAAPLTPYATLSATRGLGSFARAPPTDGDPHPRRALPSAPALTRQPSIRRIPARSRTVDFTDFTSRRRSSVREGNNITSGIETDTDDPTAPTTISSYLSPSNTTGVPPRRFFPSRRPELPWNPIPESVSNASTVTSSGTGTAATSSMRSSPTPATTQMDARAQRTFLSWLPSTTLLSLPPPPPVDPHSPRVTPRLRRGGVRPPESLLPRPHVTMLRTGSPEPIAGSTPASTSSAIAAAEGNLLTPALGHPSTPVSGVAPAPVNTPRVQSPTPVE
ncbi:hypothetical protein F5148DRAFT_1286521 [Russula earlei]|uniref:Uncharacterized protein n=1 Tax=Russula earlei TaxID=71964 RepID=A0ACC0U5C3_9AGAM|nr:hypothetical protein F5148DRAFT_1286521 [Russula earlei]